MIVHIKVLEESFTVHLVQEQIKIICNLNLKSSTTLSFLVPTQIQYYTLLIFSCDTTPPTNNFKPARNKQTASKQ